MIDPVEKRHADWRSERPTQAEWQDMFPVSTYAYIPPMYEVRMYVSRFHCVPWTRGIRSSARSCFVLLAFPPSFPPSPADATVASVASVASSQMRLAKAEKRFSQCSLLQRSLADMQVLTDALPSVREIDEQIW